MSVSIEDVTSRGDREESLSPSPVAAAAVDEGALKPTPLPPPIDPEASPAPPVASSSPVILQSHAIASPVSPAGSSASSGVVTGAAVSLPIRLHSLTTTYTAKSNHFLQCDPIAVVAVDSRPMIKTSIRSNSTSCSWNLSDPVDIQPVPGGLDLTAISATSLPTLRIPVADLATSRLQVHQEDYSQLKVGDDLGGWSMPIEEIVTRSLQRADATAAATTPTDGSWYPVAIEGASLLDRTTGRHLGEVSLKLSVELESYLRSLVASQTGLHLLYELTQQFLAAPSPSTPLRHILLHSTSLKAFIQLIVKAGADKGSMEGERLRDRAFQLVGKAIDVWGQPILDAFFAHDSELWTILFQLRRCIPLTTLSSTTAFHAYETIWDSFIALVERVALQLEPPPPAPTKSAEELEAEAAAEAAAAKRAAAKEKRRAAAIARGEDPDEESMAAASGSNKKKKKLLGSTSLPEPPTHPATSLLFGLNTLDLLHELFDVIRIRLCGFKKAIEIDWSSETKIAEFVRCCELWYKVNAFLQRFGSPTNLARPSGEDRATETDSGIMRMADEEIRPFFLKETGDVNALWLQKQLVSAVKKSRDTLADNGDLATTLQQHCDYWLRHFPVEKSEKADKKKQHSTAA